MILGLIMKGSLLVIAGLYAMVLMISLTEGKPGRKKDQENDSKINDADVDKNESESKEEDGHKSSQSGSGDDNRPITINISSTMKVSAKGKPVLQIKKKSVMVPAPPIYLLHFVACN